MSPMVRDVAKNGVGTVSVGSASTLVMAANTNRAGAAFFNNSNEDIYLALGVPAELAKGIELPTGAGGAPFKIDANFLFRGAVYAICSSGSKVLSFVEL